MYKVEMRQALAGIQRILDVEDDIEESKIIATRELIKKVINRNLLIQARLYIDYILNYGYDDCTDSIGNNWQYFADDCKQLLEELIPIYQSIRKIRKDGVCIGFHVTEINPMALKIIKNKVKQNDIDGRILNYINYSGLGSKGYTNEAYCLEKISNNEEVNEQLVAGYEEFINFIDIQLKIKGVAYMLINNMGLADVEKSPIVQKFIIEGFQAFVISYECDSFWRIRISK